MVSSEAAATPPRTAVIPIGDDATSLVAAARVAQAVAARPDLSQGGRGVVIAALLPPAGQARTAPKADQLAQEALKLFQQLDFKHARASITKAIERCKRQIKGGMLPDRYVESLHLLAAIELFDGHREAAARAMRDAALFDGRPPSPRRFNPTVQRFHREVTGTRLTEGVVKFKTSPVALVWDGDRFAGVGDGALDLRPGLHLVRLFRPGFALWQQWLRIRPGKERTVSVELRAGPTHQHAAMIALRDEVKAAAPGPATQRLMVAHAADRALLIAASAGCQPQRCELTIRQVEGRSWTASGHASLTAGNLQQVSAAIAANKLQGVSPGGAPSGCTHHSECPLEQQCRAGACVAGGGKQAQGITQKWWFWTLIGVAAAGTAAAIALPLALRDGPVIELQ